MKNKRFKATLISILIVTVFGGGTFFSDLESHDKANVITQVIGALMVIIPIFIGGDSLRKSEK